MRLLPSKNSRITRSEEFGLLDCVDQVRGLISTVRRMPAQHKPEHRYQPQHMHKYIAVAHKLMGHGKWPDPADAGASLAPLSKSSR
jgi:hypothetical protein